MYAIRSYYDIDEDFYQFRKIVPIQDNWKIIATSRLNFQEFNCLQLGTLSDKETLELFYKHYHLQQNDKLVLDLFKPLSQHTLTRNNFVQHTLYEVIRKIIIEEIYENYPADKAGFKVGDIITKVGDQIASSKNYDDISVLMKVV